MVRLSLQTRTHNLKLGLHLSEFTDLGFLDSEVSPKKETADVFFMPTF